MVMSIRVIDGDVDSGYRFGISIRDIDGDVDSGYRFGISIRDIDGDIVEVNQISIQVSITDIKDDVDRITKTVSAR